MVDILHRVSITSPLNAVYEAITSRDGLADWWAVDTQGSPEVGGVLEFRFELGGIDMKVVELDPAGRVLWQVVAGPGEWIGTHVSWDLRADGDQTVLLFKHEGWKEPVEFMYHCTTKWGTFLLSLKSLVETGKGAPKPHDVRLGNWG